MTLAKSIKEILDDAVLLGKSQDNQIFMEAHEKWKSKALTAILQEIKAIMPEKKPKVTKRKGYYPPYQPQVEQHERQGWNAYHNELLRRIT